MKRFLGTLALLLVLALGPSACREKGGEALWSKACVHIGKRQAGEAKKQFTKEKCLGHFRRLGRDDADAFARCVLTKTTDKEMLTCPTPSSGRALLRERTQTKRDLQRRMLEDAKRRMEHYRARAQERTERQRTERELQRLRLQLQTAFQRERAWPASLPGQAALHRDAWGKALRYERHVVGYHLCSAGPDGAFDTQDDLCVTEAGTPEARPR